MTHDAVVDLPNDSCQVMIELLPSLRGVVMLEESRTSPDSELAVMMLRWPMHVAVGRITPDRLVRG
jgi:hypothetical protein